MSKSVVAYSLGLALALGISGYGSQVIAQAGLIVGGQSSNFGARTLTPGFLPDPVQVPVVSGGGIDARTLGLPPGCIGYVTRRPDFILRMTGNSPSLRIYVQVPGAAGVTRTDTTLIVNTGRGEWRCNDDSFGTANPSVELPGAGAGQYDIWVGSYLPNANARGVLNITEVPGNHP